MTGEKDLVKMGVASDLTPPTKPLLNGWGQRDAN